MDDLDSRASRVSRSRFLLRRKANHSVDVSG
jgi:hypothetical protein